MAKKKATKKTTKRKKTGGKDWVKGQSGNPKGRPPMPKAVREALKMNKAKFTELLMGHLGKNSEEVEAKLRDPNTNMLDKMVLRIILIATKDGDYRALNFILDRGIGKVKEEVEVNDVSTHSRIMELIDLQKKANGES